MPSPGTYNQQAPVPYEQVAGHPPLHVASLGSSAVGTGQLPSYPSSSGPSKSDASSGTLGKRPAGHPLKSFSVPAPPPQSAPTTPQPKHIGKLVFVSSSLIWCVHEFIIKFFKPNV